MKTPTAGKPKTTRQSLTKVPGITGLYRHDNGSYYAVKKHRGAIKTQSLKTKGGDPIADKRIAEAALKVWLEKLDSNQSPEDAKLTLKGLIERFIKTKEGASESQQENVLWMAKKFGYQTPDAPAKTNNRGANRTRLEGCVWERGLDVRVTDIRPSDLSSFMGKFSYMKPNSLNTLGEYVRQLFEVAVADNIVSQSPFETAKGKRKKVQKEPRPTPDDEQFKKIVTSIRTQKFSGDAEDSADLAEFLGLAGLGEAEAAQFHWKDFDFKKPYFNVQRFKTKTWFQVPYYPKLKKFLESLYKRQNSPDPSAKVFKVRSIKRALEGACDRLEIPSFCPRSLRRRAIVEQIRAGVNVKLVSRWQGHQDGGKLILNTYSEVFSANDRKFELAELAKLPS